MRWILCDIGGTHIRFATPSPHGPQHFSKYKLVEHADLQDAVLFYCKEQEIEPPEALALSSTSWLEDGEIRYRRFADNAPMQIRISDLKKDLNIKDILFLNDLEAGCHGLGSLNEDRFLPIKPSKGSPTNAHKCLLNIGTGAGHAYLFENGKVLKTYGGHVPLAATNEDQFEILSWIKTNRPQGRDPIIEDVLSTHGLQWMYACSAGEKEDRDFQDLLDVLKEKTPQAEKTLTLFAQFLGQHVQNLAHLPFIYGGLYLTGGVMDALIERNLLDLQVFERFFTGKAVSVVENSVHSMGVFYCSEPNLPLLGLNLKIQDL